MENEIKAKVIIEVRKEGISTVIDGKDVLVTAGIAAAIAHMSEQMKVNPNIILADIKSKVFHFQKNGDKK